MCFFKKKKVEPVINSEYKVGELIRFHYRDDLYIGRVYKVKLDEEHQVVYDIQVGGECPSYVFNVKGNQVVHKR